MTLGDSPVSGMPRKLRNMFKQQKPGLALVGPLLRVAVALKRQSQVRWESRRESRT
jgi:hypothetical protein